MGGWLRFAVLGWLVAPSLVGAAVPDVRSGARIPVHEQTSAERRWPHVELYDPIAANKLRRLLDNASDALGGMECQQLLTDFCDVNGQALTVSMQQLTDSPAEYLRHLYFKDGRNQRLCSTGTYAFTMPFSRVIWICSQHLEGMHAVSRHATGVIIHEMLHSLGLGENPPSSEEITSQVLKRCGKRIRDY